MTRLQRWTILLYLVLAILIPACSPQPTPAAEVILSPEEFLLQLQAQHSDETSQNFQILGRREWERGVLLFVSYDYTRLSMGSFGYSLLERVPGEHGWAPVGGFIYGRPQAVPASEYIDWSVGRSGGMTKVLGMPLESHLDPVVYFGRVISPEVQALEMVFAGGQVLRDEAEDGFFAFVTQPGDRTCAIRVLGSSDLLLRQIDLTQEQPGALGIASPDQSPACPMLFMGIPNCLIALIPNCLLV
jgi:hypothetical protein